MPEPEYMTQLMHSFFDHAFFVHLRRYFASLIRPTQPMRRDDRNQVSWIGLAENEVETLNVEIHAGHGKQRTLLTRASSNKHPQNNR